MKTLMMFSILMMVFTGCAIFAPQEAQEERRRLLAMRDAARERHNPERVKQAVKDLLVGKWQYVDLEVEEGNVYAQRAKSVPQQVLDSLNTTIKGLAKGVTGEQTAGPNAPEQITPQSNAATPEKDEQQSEVNRQNRQGEATRLPPIEVTGEKIESTDIGSESGTCCVYPQKSHPRIFRGSEFLLLQR